jgi:hypothetical protein
MNKFLTSMARCCTKSAAAHSGLGDVARENGDDELASHHSDAALAHLEMAQSALDVLKATEPDITKAEVPEADSFDHFVKIEG